jgi:hypothetical protein
MHRVAPYQEKIHCHVRACHHVTFGCAHHETQCVRMLQVRALQECRLYGGGQLPRLRRLILICCAIRGSPLRSLCRCCVCTSRISIRSAPKYNRIPTYRPCVYVNVYIHNTYLKRCCMTARGAGTTNGPIMCMHIYKCVYTHANVCMNLFVCVYIYIYIHIHTYTYIHTHTLTHECTHTHTYRRTNEGAVQRCETRATALPADCRGELRLPGMLTYMALQQRAP